MAAKNLSANTWKLIALLLGLFVVFIWPHTDRWEDTGLVDLRTSDSARTEQGLEARIEVTKFRNGWFTDSLQYRISSVYLDNGDALDFRNCTASKGVTAKCSENGTMYYLDVTEAPEQPDAELLDVNY